MKYCFDLDGTLCTNTDGDYDKAVPFLNRIKRLNDLYDDGHTIKIESARGSTTGIDWSETTKKQLIDWGVKYHELRVGVKMDADIFIDDKGVGDKEFFKKIERENFDDFLKRMTGGEEYYPSEFIFYLSIYVSENGLNPRRAILNIKKIINAIENNKNESK